MSSEFDRVLTKIAISCDNYLEDKYQNLYPIHPNRAKRGKASNGLYDGLFATFFKFSTGYGSKFGRGYIISIEIRTLSFVEKNIKNEIEENAIEFIKKELVNTFKDQDLSVVKDGNLFKLIGDFTLD